MRSNRGISLSALKAERNRSVTNSFGITTAFRQLPRGASDALPSETTPAQRWRLTNPRKDVLSQVFRKPRHQALELR